MQDREKQNKRGNVFKCQTNWSNYKLLYEPSVNSWRRLYVGHFLVLKNPLNTNTILWPKVDKNRVISIVICFRRVNQVRSLLFETYPKYANKKESGYP